MAEINKYIQKVIDSGLKTVLASVVKEREAEAAKLVVYDAYSPKDYDRRGSLMQTDDEHMSTTVVNGTLVVTNIASFNDKLSMKNSGRGLAYLVEGGDGSHGFYYNWRIPNDREPTYLEPRPFIEITRETLRDSSELSDELKNWLRANGINAQ